MTDIINEQEKASANAARSMRKALVIGRSRSEIIINALNAAYGEVVYISARDTSTQDFTPYAGYDLIFATNPYRGKYNLEYFINSLKHVDFVNVFYLNTYTTNAHDMYQLTKLEEEKVLDRFFEIISLNIPFMFNSEYDKNLLRGKIAGGFSAPYINEEDLAEAFNNISRIEPFVKYLDSYNPPDHYQYLVNVRRLLWSSSLVQYKYFNLMFKIMERIILRLTGSCISLCYLTGKAGSDV